ncbi:YdcF family protein [Actinomadura viridis]|uniref:YdcF family protein n=1 Tax=Actinomadura viridis TaxID=58110 RepID=UPI0036870331
MIDDISPEQIPAITRFVDTQAPPPDDKPTAHFIFGTNQVQPVDIVAERHHQGLAPLIIATGGVNRHNGIIEGQVFRRLLIERGVPEDAIRVEDRSANTWENVEFALPFLREALEADLTITAVCKWYHRRAIHVLKTVFPEVGPFHAISWVPIYEGKPITRQDWPAVQDGSRRVVREWQEVSRRVADGSFTAVELVDDAWL